MRQRGPRVWDLIGCGVLILVPFLGELAFSITHTWNGDLVGLAIAFGPPLLIGIFLVVGGMFGRTWQARWRSRH